MFTYYIMPIFSATIATVGFGILYNIPKRTIPASATTSGLGWIVYFICTQVFHLPLFVGTTLASFTIALISQLFAKHYRMPVTIFAIPAIIPLVPGGSAYNSMLAFVTGEILSAMRYLIETFIVAGGLALGLTVHSAIFQVLSPRAIIQQGRRYLP